MKNGNQSGSSSSAPFEPVRGKGLRHPLDWPASAGAVGDVLQEMNVRLKRRRWRRNRRIAGATLGLLVAGFLGHFVVQRFAAGQWTPPASAVVSLPERQELPDGSMVEIRNGARITVAFTDLVRRVVLERGEAHFQVTKDQRRVFVVVAGGVEFRAVGTAFAVHLSDNTVEMFVTEGRVAVQARRETEGREQRPGNQHRGPESPQPIVVSASNFVVVDVAASRIPASVVQAISPADLRQRLAWRAPKLEFSGTPLIEVVNMINRHSADDRKMRIVLGDPSLAAARISGILRADNVDILLDVLETDYGVRAERRGGAEIVLYRVSVPPRSD